MKRFVIVFSIIICFYQVVKSQDSLRVFSAEIEFEYTGKIMNDADSLFNVYYYFDLWDFEDGISSLSISGGDKISTSDILQGTVPGYRQIGNTIQYSMGEFKYGDQIKWVRFYDSEQTVHKVILKAYFGELFEPSLE
jgi:hypothetical protein